MSQSYSADGPMQAAGFYAKVSQKADPTNVFKVTNENTAAGKNIVKTENFPMKMGSVDPYDTTAALKGSLIQRDGIIPGVGMAIAGPEDMDYIQRKMQMSQFVDFQDWLFRQADWSTPESSQYWNTMFPEIGQRKVEEIDRVIGQQRTKALINLRGPQSREDWLQLWMEQKGLVKVPETPVHLLPKDRSANTRGYERGMFSIMTELIPPFNRGALKGEYKHIPNNAFVWDNPTNNNTILGPRPYFPNSADNYYPAPNQQNLLA